MTRKARATLAVAVVLLVPVTALLATAPIAAATNQPATNQPINASLDASGPARTVDPLTDDAAITVDTNRSTPYNLTVSADGLTAEQLRGLFDTAAVAEFHTDAGDPVPREYYGFDGDATVEEVLAEGYLSLSLDRETVTEWSTVRVPINTSAVEGLKRPATYHLEVLREDAATVAQANMTLDTRDLPTTALRYRFTVPRTGGVYTVGVPGDQRGDLADMLPPNESGYVVYGFRNGSFDHITDFENTTLDALDAVAINTQATASDDPIPVKVRLENRRVPATRELAAGWNFVAAPHYGQASRAFGVDGVTAMYDPFLAPWVNTTVLPTTQRAGYRSFDSTPENRVSPWKGYLVHAKEPTAIPSRVVGVNDRYELDRRLGYDPSTGWFGDE